jgi:hypothetical protein
VSGRPVVLLDVDGVLNLGLFDSSAIRSSRQYHDRWVNVRLHGQSHEPRIVLNPRWGGMLRSLMDEGAELAWATAGWQHGVYDANYSIGRMLGLPMLEQVPCEWLHKASTVIPWTNGRPWAWLEDGDYELEAAVRRTHPGVPCLPVLVSPETGLTGEHVQAVAEWLRALRD